jgi:hypothetical protein
VDAKTTMQKLHRRLVSLAEARVRDLFGGIKRLGLRANRD